MMRESGITDATSARSRAATRLGVSDPRDLPDLDEIQAALRSEQRLFAGEQHSRHQQRLREAAVEAMTFFSRFDPRIVGAVLDGSAEPHSAVCLHLFADNSEAVIQFLNEHTIVHVHKTCAIRLDRERTIRADKLEFSANGIPFELIVLPRSALRQVPLMRGSDTPMTRASLPQLRELLATSESTR